LLFQLLDLHLHFWLTLARLLVPLLRVFGQCVILLLYLLLEVDLLLIKSLPKFLLHLRQQVAVLLLWLLDWEPQLLSLLFLPQQLHLQTLVLYQALSDYMILNEVLLGEPLAGLTVSCWYQI
jgi:hypothetical protein